MQFESKDQAQRWQADIERCNTAILQNEVRNLQEKLESERQSAKREQQARELLYMNQELEIKKIENTKRTLLVRLLKCIESNTRHNYFGYTLLHRLSLRASPFCRRGAFMTWYI